MISTGSSTDSSGRRSRRFTCGLLHRLAALVIVSAGGLAFMLLLLQGVADAAAGRPNVVLVMTDDQGYGDLGCHGNDVIRTPALDRLHAESVRLTDFHVDPTCSPTRAALMTGRYSSRTGVWHTVMGRSIIRSDEVTLAQLMADAGYRTGIFGKWHLGDNYPSRPQDMGFHEVLIHGGGGVGQTPDYWGNDYFDDTYFHNSEPKEFDGYCTDVWFDGALKFIERHRDRPFFAYIPTNAPHAPFLVDAKYSRPYREMGVPSPRAEFYGMIENFDENIARLRKKLRELELDENTLLIFLTDNGTAAGIDNRGGFNAGMRGRKGSEYEGGHRVPCFFHWPAGGLTGGRDVTPITAHIDILPTLTEYCGLKLPEGVQIDGRSLVPLLEARAVNEGGDEEATAANTGSWPSRTLFVHSQRVEHPQKWKQSAVMTDRWRLVNGKELYDLTADPGQERDVAADHREVVAELRDAYDAWWDDISERFDEYVRIGLGSPRENPATLTCHDWHAPMNQIPWNQPMVRRSPAANGWWAVEVLRDGRYEITLRMRPAYVEHRLKGGTARLKIGDVEQTQPVESGAAAVTFTVELKAGPARLQTWLDEPDGTSRGAFFIDVENR
jgi:arylsulfatase A-like enzyme